MSRRLAVVLFIGLHIASVALWVSDAITKACTWACPHD